MSHNAEASYFMLTRDVQIHDGARTVQAFLEVVAIDRLGH